MHESYQKWLDDKKSKVFCKCGCGGDIIIKEDLIKLGCELK